MSASGNVNFALQEVQRGLAYQPSSELHLLGAILCKRMERFEDMRHHVAAIPVDDPLRGEAEWMLRSHQARQRAPVQSQAPVERTRGWTVSQDDVLPVVMDDVQPSSHPRRGRSAVSLVQAVLLLALAAVILFGGWIVWQHPPAGLAELWPDSAQGDVTEQTGGASSDAPIVPAAADAVAPADPEVGQPDPLATQATEPSNALPSPEGQFSLPTPTIAPDLVQSSGTPQRVVSTDPEAAVAAADQMPFDLRAYLEQAGRQDLAALPVTARVDGGSLVLEGTVEMAEQRAAIEELAGQAPGIVEVLSANVRLRLPDTYTVQSGDTLWGIAVKLYGDPDKIKDLYAANQATMPSPDALAVGMELKVPKD